MGQRKYLVELTEAQRQQLLALIASGERKARQLTRARVLLLADEHRPNGCISDAHIADLLHVSRATIHRIRQRFVTTGLSAALEEQTRPGRPNVFCSRDAAHITALACSDPPEGHGKFSYSALRSGSVGLVVSNALAHFDNVVVTGPDIPDGGPGGVPFSVRSKDKLATMWGTVKQER